MAEPRPPLPAGHVAGYPGRAAALGASALLPGAGDGRGEVRGRAGRSGQGVGGELTFLINSLNFLIFILFVCFSYSHFISFWDYVVSVVGLLILNVSVPEMTSKYEAYFFYTKC